MWSWEWFSQRPAGSLYLSVLTLGALRKGVKGLADAKRRQVLLDWLEAYLPAYFSGRILAIDVSWAGAVAPRDRPTCTRAIVPRTDLVGGYSLRFHNSWSASWANTF